MTFSVLYFKIIVLIKFNYNVFKKQRNLEF